MVLNAPNVLSRELARYRDDSNEEAILALIIHGMKLADLLYLSKQCCVDVRDVGNL